MRETGLLKEANALLWSKSVILCSSTNTLFNMWKQQFHSLLSGTFKRSGFKMQIKIKSACVGSRSSKRLLTREQGGRDFKGSSQYSCWKGFTTTIQTAVSGSIEMLQWHESLTAEHLGQPSPSDPKEKLGFLTPSSYFTTTWKQMRGVKL